MYLRTDVVFLTRNLDVSTNKMLTTVVLGSPRIELLTQSAMSYQHNTERAINVGFLFLPTESAKQSALH